MKKSVNNLIQIIGIGSALCGEGVQNAEAGKIFTVPFHLSQQFPELAENLDNPDGVYRGATLSSGGNFLNFYVGSEGILFTAPQSGSLDTLLFRGVDFAETFMSDGVTLNDMGERDHPLYGNLDIFTTHVYEQGINHPDEFFYGKFSPGSFADFMTNGGFSAVTYEGGYGKNMVKFDYNFDNVPEPSSGLLVGSGILVATLARRFLKKDK